MKTIDRENSTFSLTETIGVINTDAIYAETDARSVTLTHRWSNKDGSGGSPEFNDLGPFNERKLL